MVWKDKLDKINDEIDECDDLIEKTEEHITELEESQSDEVLREGFLEENKSELDEVKNKFEQKIDSLEEKREAIYSVFYRKAKEINEEYANFCGSFYKKNKKVEKSVEDKRRKKKESLLSKNKLLLKKWRIDLIVANYFILAYHVASSKILDVKEKRRIAIKLRKDFIQKENLDNLEVLILDQKAWQFLKKRNVENGLYNRFVKENNLDENEKTVFDENKSGEEIEISDEIYENLEEKYIEDNNNRFSNFSNHKKSIIDEKIKSAEKKVEDLHEMVSDLSSERRRVKQLICPKCEEDKQADESICQDCAIAAASRKRARESRLPGRYYDYADYDGEEKEIRTCVMCGAPLRTRYKYCSSCRPSGKQKPYWAPKEERLRTYEENYRRSQSMKSFFNAPRPRPAPVRQQQFRPAPVRQPQFRPAPVRRSPAPAFRWGVGQPNPNMFKLKRRPRVGW